MLAGVSGSGVVHTVPLPGAELQFGRTAALQLIAAAPERYHKSKQDHVDAGSIAKQRHGYQSGISRPRSQHAAQRQ